MKQNQPAADQSTTDAKKEVAKPSGTHYEDWLDKVELMEKFNISSRTVDYFVAKGIFNYTYYGGAKYFYLPGIRHSFEANYR